MAVEAHRLSPIFSSQYWPNREISSPVDANGLIYGSQMRYDVVPLLGSTTATDDTALNPMCNLAATTTLPATDYLIPLTVKPPIQSVDSSVTLNGNSNGNNGRLLPVSSLRKRSREDSVIVNPLAMPQSPSYMQFQKPCNDPIMFLGHDMSLNVQQQQLDVDRSISHHIEMMRMEMEEKRKSQGRRIVEAIEEGLMRKLRTKDEEIEKIGKLNMFLEEKVKSLCFENQIWRGLAQSHEATANALRNNLEQVLAAVERSRWDDQTAAVAGDEQSSCGSCSNGGGEEEEEVGSEEEQDREKARKMCLCRSCGEGEACVLVLPCRHLCLCTQCGSSLHICPICKSPKNASVHINVSS